MIIHRRPPNVRIDYNEQRQKRRQNFLYDVTVGRRGVQEGVERIDAARIVGGLACHGVAGGRKQEPVQPRKHVAWYRRRKVCFV